MDSLELIYITLLGACGTGLAYLIKDRRSLRADHLSSLQDLENVRKELTASEAHRTSMEQIHQEKVLGLQQMIADRDNSIESIKQDKNQQIETLKSERVSVLDDIKTFLGKDFKNTSNDVFDKANEKLFSRFDQYFRNQNKLAKKDIEGIVNPINETLDLLTKSNKDFASSYERDFSSIYSLVGQTNQTMEKTMLETAKLTTALKGSTKTAGRWGEEQLKRILEISQMSEYSDYKEQDVLEDSSRPDVMIYLPGKRQIIIDSKVSIKDYIDAEEATDPILKKSLLASHAKNIRSHMQSLSKKKYWDSLDNSIDLVVMFVPGDNFLNAALQEDPQLFHDAMKSKVIITGPQTLFITLKTFSLMWSKDKQSREAGKIIEIGRELLRRFQNMAEHITSLGDNIRKTGNSYNSFIGSMDSKFIPKASELAEYFPELEDKKKSQPKLVEDAIKDSSKLISSNSSEGHDR